MTHRQRHRHRHKRRSARHTGLLVAAVALVAVLIAGLSAVGYVVTVYATGPDYEELKPIDKGATSVIFAADGSRLGYVRSDVVRTPIAWEKMPRALRQATVAIEDERFYAHQGVDFESIVRASIKNLESGKTVQGGSTITQQLVRALYIEDAERNIERKIREAKLAAQLEKRKTKRWILHQYLNSVPYGTVNGRTAVGIEAAASVFFSKHARDLTLAEAALLAGLPQAPSQYNPLRNPNAALERRNEVLSKMAELRYVTLAEAEEAMAADLGLNPGDRYTQRREPYFFDYVEEQLIERYGVNVYRQGGLKIHTTIDPRLQDAGRRAIRNHLNLREDPASAVVSIDPSNGHIKAMASSGTYDDRTFNLAAQGRRQPGSAFKTMVLVTALRRGVDPRRTTYVSKPLALQIPGYGAWKVKTYDNTYGGRMDLVRATLKSDNSVYAQLDVDLGPKEVARTARLMGIRTKLDGIPSEGLGGLRLGVSPLEMASAYATLAAGGMYAKPKSITRVVFKDGKTDDLGTTKRKRVFPDGVAYEATKILEQNVSRGTGGNAAIGCPSAGKTGTTDNYNDAWYVGYTPKLSTAVWVGYPNALREMRNVHGVSVAGGTFPAMIWRDFMNVAKRGFCGGFPPPKEPIQFRPFFGRYATTGSAETDPDNDGYRSPGGGAGDNSAGGGDYRGYDPRLYEAPPQQPPSTRQPEPEPAPTEPPPSGGGGGGGGAPPGGGAPSDPKGGGGGAKPPG
jgi:penicillin-binding protein 1A